MKHSDKMNLVARALTANGYDTAVQDDCLDIWGPRGSRHSYVELTECYQDDSDFMILTGGPEQDDVEIDVTNLDSDLPNLMAALDTVWAGVFVK